MNSDDYFEYEGRLYPNPTKTRDETLSFVDSLRNTVSRDNQAIATQTERLGTDVSSNLGGLTGSESYFTQRYQTTPIEYQVNTLKATAQADALNKLMTNYKNQAANRYQQAYRNAARSASSTGGGTNGTGSNNGSNSDNDNTSGWNGDFEESSKNSPIQYTFAYKTPYKDPVRVFIDNTASIDDSDRALSQLGQGSDGRLGTVDGVQYVWSNYGQYGPAWYKVAFSGRPGGY